MKNYKSTRTNTSQSKLVLDSIKSNKTGPLKKEQCPVLLLIAVINTMTKNDLEEGFISSYTL